jgi:hypothetical protein
MTARKTVSLAVQVTATCPTCGQPLHVQGLSESAVCGACQHALALPLSTWLAVLSLDDVLEAMEATPGQLRQCQMFGVLNCSYVLGPQAPACSACDAPVPLAAVGGAAASGGFSCACGATVAVRAADDLCRAIVPGAAFVVGEGAMGEAGPDSGGSAPVMFQCMSCGGALHVDGSSRTVTCSYCSGVNYLPDGLWLRLHPPSKARRVFVLVDQEGATGLSPELLARLVASDDCDLRQRAAASDGLSAEQVQRLLADDDCDVREALAGNPQLGAEHLALVADDDDADVREALLRNPSVTAQIVDHLATDQSYRIRRAAVCTGRVSERVLAELAGRETDNDVLEALVRNRLPASVLAALAGNRDRDARRAAADAPGLPQELHLRLAQDDDRSVRELLARRADLAGEAALVLADGDDASIAALARQQPGYAVVAAARRRRRWMITAAVALVLGCAGVGGGLIAAIGFALRQSGLHLRF